MLSNAAAPRAPQAFTALVLLSFFLADVRDGLGPFLATYLQEQGVAQHMIGITMTAGGLAAVFATPVAGALADRSTWKRALLAAGSVAVLAASAIAFTTLSPGLLIATQIVTGAAGALVLALIAALTLGLVHAAGFKHQTGRNEAWSHAGNMVSAIGAGLLAHWLGAPWMLVVMAAFTAGALLSLRAIDPAAIDHAAARGDEPIDASAGGPDAPVAPASSHEGTEAWAPLLRNRPLLMFGLTCALFHLGNAAMLPLLNQRLAATVADSAPLLWTGVAIVVAQLTMVPVALWVSRSTRFDVAWFVYLALLVLPVRGMVAYAFTSAWGNIPVQVLDGIAAGALGVATPLMVQRYAEGSGRFNTALGMVITLQGIGAALSPGVANFVVGAQGHFALAFVVLSAAAVLALPLFWLAQRGSAARGSGPADAAATGPAGMRPALATTKRRQ